MNHLFTLEENTHPLEIHLKRAGSSMKKINVRENDTKSIVLFLLSLLSVSM